MRPVNDTTPHAVARKIRAAAAAMSLKDFFMIVIGAKIYMFFNNAFTKVRKLCKELLKFARVGGIVYN